MPTGCEFLINKLWEDFQLYIKGNWGSAIEYGIKDGKTKKRILLQDFGDFVPLNQVQPQIKFCQILCEILKHNLSQKDKTGFKVPHENTMRGFLKAGLSVTTQKNTLNAFAAFLGYEHWDDYRRRNSKYIVQETTSTKEQVVGTIKIVKAPIKKINNRLRVMVFYSIGFFICIAIGIRIYFNTINSKHSIEKGKIISALLQANKAEFEAYTKVPVLDTTSLDAFFINKHPEGSARASIIGALTRRKEAGCVLIAPMSSYNLIDIEVKKIEDTIAYLTTTEKWHLRWYDTLQHQEAFIYDTTNVHDYILVKQNSTWKILMDNYKGRLRRPLFAVK